MHDTATVLHKVTAFVLRQQPARTTPDLLLFQHPYLDGLQFPAGTVEPGEDIATAARREAEEETGLDGFGALRPVAEQVDPLPPDRAYALRATTVYARPDATSFDWVRLPRGICVTRLRQQNGFVQIDYVEGDREPDPAYTSFRITGWVAESALAARQVRHFFVMMHPGDTPERWTAFTDNHTFTLQWVPLDAVPAINRYQAHWLGLLRDYLNSADYDQDPNHQN